MEGLGFGMAAVAFWGFVASCVVSGIWYAIREKEAEHATLRSMIESGKEIDAELVEKIVGDNGKSEDDLRVAGLITMSVAPGLVILGYVLKVAAENEKVFPVLSGVAGLVFFVATGLLLAARVLSRSKSSDNDKPLV